MNNIDYVELVAAMYRERIANGETVNNARYFDITNLKGVKFVELENLTDHLEYNGYIGRKYTRGFYLSDKAIADFTE